MKRLGKNYILLAMIIIVSIIVMSSSWTNNLLSTDSSGQAARALSAIEKGAVDSSTENAKTGGITDPVLTKKCRDSDVNITYPDGINPYLKGTAILGRTTKIDFCRNYNSTKLVEYYCGKGEILSKDIDCIDYQKICTDGACRTGPVCGNGVKEGYEQCDESDWGNITSCADFGFTGGLLSCNSNCQFDTTQCILDVPICGDNITQPELGEQCDEQDLGGHQCSDFGFGQSWANGILSCIPPGQVGECTFDTSNCDKGSGWCGNNQIDHYPIDGVPNVEQCDGTLTGGDWGNIVDCTDFGFTGGTLTCNANSASRADMCKFNTTSCESPAGYGYCGDMVLNKGEQCEANIPFPLLCTDFDHFVGGTIYCNNCQYDLSQCIVMPEEYCGDGNVTGLEQCDGSVPNGLDCTDIGSYIGGNLTCIPQGLPNECTLDITGCYATLGDFQLLSVTKGNYSQPTAHFNVDILHYPPNETVGPPPQWRGFYEVITATQEDGSPGVALALWSRFYKNQTYPQTRQVYIQGHPLTKYCTWYTTNLSFEEDSWGGYPRNKFFIKSIRYQTPCFPNCGNGNAEPEYEEECDGLDLNGRTCGDLGFIGGILNCNQYCDFNTQNCDRGYGYCGDGNLSFLEECDGNNTGGLDCTMFGPYTGGILSCNDDCTFDLSNCTYEPQCTTNSQCTNIPSPSCMNSTVRRIYTGLCTNNLCTYPYTNTVCPVNTMCSNGVCVNSTGNLYAVSSPTNASLYVDNIYKGTTPRTVTGLTIGSHTYRISKTGYLDAIGSKYIYAGQTTTVNVTLAVNQSQTGNLYVVSAPSGANLYVDNSYKGLTPIAVTGLTVGNHNVKLSKQGYYDRIVTKYVYSGQTSIVNVTMILNGTGNLELLSNPSQANVYLDDVYKGLTPITVTGLTLAEAPYMIKFTKTGYYDYYLVPGILVNYTYLWNITLTPTTTPRPDLIIEDILLYEWFNNTLLGDNIPAGTLFYMVPVLKNIGNAPANLTQYINIEYVFGTSLHESYHCILTSYMLQPGESITCESLGQYGVISGYVGTYSMSLFADYFPNRGMGNMAESDEMNNQRTETVTVY